MPTVVYLPDAKEDLFEIWRYVCDQSGSEDVADGVIDRIDDAAKLIATQPGSGTPRSDLAASLRAFTVGDYVVFYMPKSESIEVVQVIHGSRDIPVRFRPPRHPQSEEP